MPDLATALPCEKMGELDLTPWNLKQIQRGYFKQIWISELIPGVDSKFRNQLQLELIPTLFPKE